MAKAKEEKKVADILGMLVVLDRGNFVINAGREFQELTEAVKAANKKGVINIKLEVTPSGWKESTGACNQVEVRPNIVLTKPKREHGKSIFFVTDDNTLTRDDPDQTEIFNEAGSVTEEVKNGGR